MERKILKQVLQEKDLSVGIIQQLIYPEVTEYLAGCDLDFIILDLEHTGHTIESANSCILAAAAHNIPMIVRVWEKEQSLIEQVLDAGAQGVVVPTVETPEECQMIASSAHYAPEGTRGWCNIIPAKRWMNRWENDPWGDDFEVSTFCKIANCNVFVTALVESPLGFRNLPDLLQVDGIDCFMLGPGDLSVRLGKNLWSKEITDMINDAVIQISLAGKQSCPLATADNIPQLRANGTRMVMLGMGERTSMQERLRAEVKKIRDCKD